MTTTPIAANPSSAKVRYEINRAERRAEILKTIHLPQYNKTWHLLHRLEDGPMTRAQVFAYLGSKQFTRVKRAGAIELFESANPEYEHGKKYAKPLCTWVRLGNRTYRAKSLVKPGRKYCERTIERAIKVLRSTGYTVIEP